MPQTLTLKKTVEPSWFNKDMLLGGLLGGFSFAAGIPVVGWVVGGAIGGYLGKRRMEAEHINGKPVSDNPSFWNKDTLIGGLAGNFVGVILGGLMLVVAGGATLLAGAPVVSAVAVVAAAATVIGSTVAGAYVGGKMGQGRLMHEFQEAKKQAIVANIGQHFSPEIAQAVDYRLSNDKEWGKQMLEEKLLSTGQQKTPV